MRCSFRKVSSSQPASKPVQPTPAQPAIEPRLQASPSPNRDDDKRSGVTFIVKAKTGGQGLVFAFVSLAHLYSFCMMLSIHSHDTSTAGSGGRRQGPLGQACTWPLGVVATRNDYNDPCVLYLYAFAYCTVLEVK